jgi:hypothetical protein
MIKMPCVTEQSCDEQPLRRPRDKKSDSCAAECTTTKRRCRNCPKVWMPTAALVIPLKGCCTLCTTHADIAKKKLVALAVSTTGALSDLALGSTLSYDEYLLLTSKVHESHPDLDGKLYTLPTPDVSQAIDNATRSARFVLTH